MTNTLKENRTAVKPIAASDPLWFKDAVIYQLHVRGFSDANDDGIGDFQGLTNKLDYIQDLGATAIWLLPFFQSPLRDDGYDISDYTRIHRAYGLLQDFDTFVREAHRREIRVISEMVMNHTSDQHEWFQRSRRSKAGEKWRDFYVWSDSDERYGQARVIFQDFETSNWTWDPVANAFFWHRFYRHQPDLNYDNPEVHQAMFAVIDFWLERGVDGVRLDGAPYLYEREGTNCENLPETHAFFKKLRGHVDEKYPDRMLLAEANQWPEDAAAYFGDGDECHMNFHFPLMPRLFMAMEREDRFPIIDILEQTPPIPDNCQWGIFLRNHDELTLEMVTDEERDFMYRTYADDPLARLNLGIRRRLAPLLRDNEQKMQLMNALLLSLPGTPIIYYGDEIRMGDNIYLGDRDGVRTPMQWNDDRNAGFSRANPQQLYLPVIIDPLFHYASRNVEVEQSRPHSMLRWMRRIIGMRKQCAAFGRGSIEFLTPKNPKVLVYLRRHNEEAILVVANLSRYVQYAELDLSPFRGQTPVELFGQVRFPPIGELPYFLTLGPHAFYWFRLEWGGEEAASLSVPLPTCTIAGRWDALFEGRPLAQLERALPGYLKRRRWFAGRRRTIQQATLLDVLTVQDEPEITGNVRRAGRSHPRGLPATRLMIVRVEYGTGEAETYVLPVVFAQGAQEANILGDHPDAGIISIARTDGVPGATLCDTTYEAEYWQLLFNAVANDRSLPGGSGEVIPRQTEAFSRLQRNMHQGGETASEKSAVGTRSTTGSFDVSVYGGEQRNASAALGGRWMLKLFRRIGRGVNPELEIGLYLTEKSRVRCVPQLAGALEYRRRDGEPYTLAVLHEYIANEGDAWTYTLDELGRYLERLESGSAGAPPSEALPQQFSLIDLADQDVPASAQETIGAYLQSAALLGQRTAELHLALAGDDDKAFAPEPFTMLYQRSLYQSMRAQARMACHALENHVNQLPELASQLGRRVLMNEETLIGRHRELARRRIAAQRTRRHGDFHLGQVLFTGKDFVIIDFEGDPDRSVGERQIKTSPLRDVASMLRSFHYATHAAIRAPQRQSPPQSGRNHDLSAWLRLWRTWSSASYLKAYLAEASRGAFLPPCPEELKMLLDAFLLDRAVFELSCELDDRPDWAQVPLEGILELLKTT